MFKKPNKLTTYLSTYLPFYHTTHKTKPYCEILQRSSENNSRRLTSLGGIVNKALFNNPTMDFDPDFPFDADFPFNDLIFNPTNLKEVTAYSEGNFPDQNTYNDLFENSSSSSVFSECFYHYFEWPQNSLRVKQL